LAKKKSQTQTAKDKQTDAEIRAAMTQPWLRMRTAIILIAITSIALGVFMAWQVAPSVGWLEAIGWGVLFGGAIWAIFYGGLWFNRFVQRGNKKE
jgi:succinate dehydrogenase hydrophobic anchor subunit